MSRRLAGFYPALESRQRVEWGKGNKQHSMPIYADFAVDMALLATTSALLHYACGFIGVIVAFVAVSLAEHGAAIWSELSDRAADMWTAVTIRNPHAHPLGDAMSKAFHRRRTWRFPTRSERTRSEACTEQDDDEGANEIDANANNTPRRQLLEPANANTLVVGGGNEASASSTTMSKSDLLREQLLARLSIHDVASTLSVDSDASSLPMSPSSSSSIGPSPRLMQLNAHAPIAFENDLFAGHVLFLVRTNPHDPRFVDLFAGKRRMFWIQVQGRFKRKPRGVVYLGGELPSRISLGIITKSIARVIMGIIQQLVGNVYMSFGGSSASSSVSPHQQSANERPAVSFPLYQSVDQFVETPAGETPPPLGHADFGESDDARTRRRQTPLQQHTFDVGPTYSFHFHTMYVDLTQWKTANLPGVSDMHLTTFFDSLPLHIVAYECTANASSSGKHLQSNKQYLFNFQVSFDARRSAAAAAAAGATTGLTGAAGSTAGAAHDRPRLWRSDSEHSCASSSESSGTALSGTSFESFGASSGGGAIAPGDDQAAITDALATIDRENACALRSVELEYLYWIEEADRETNVRRVHYVYRLHEHSDVEEDHDGDIDDSQVGERGQTRPTTRLVMVSAYKLRLLLGGKFRKLRRLYTLQSLRFHARSRIDSYSTINDEAMQVTSCLQRLVKLAQRHQVDMEPIDDGDEALVVAFESALYQILTARTHLQPPHDGASLSVEIVPVSIGVKVAKPRDPRREGAVVYRFYTDTLARQEVMALTPDSIQFYRSYSTSADKTVPTQQVIGVQSTSVPHAVAVAMDDAASLAFGFALQINTFAEEIVVCVATEQARNAWIQVILEQCCPHANFDRSLHEALLVCYTPSKSLKPANRVVLNSRSLFPRVVPGATLVDTAVDDPLQAVATVLRSALAIYRLGELADTMTILEFLNHASALRHVDLETLLRRPHEERLTFFLNLYHVVLAHAMISHGFPRSQSQWAFFQTHMCYVVGKDVHHKAQPLSMSLAEIEHVILRARLPRARELPHLRLDQLPASYAGRLVPLGLAHPDFRVSFALLMNHSGDDRRVPIFGAETVHEQLNQIVKSYVARHVGIDRQRQTVFLPRICEWFKQDFGGGGSPMYCVRKLLGFMDEETQDDALRVLDSATLVHIKYTPFKYTPRESLELLVVADAESTSSDNDE